MKGFLKNINIKDFKKYLFFSCLFIIILILVGTFSFTEARYETETELNVSPNLAFFVVGVGSQSGRINLDSLIPSNTPYTYSFNVSNFVGNRRANVDLTYSIEIITTTNMPLNFKIYKGANSQADEIDSDTTTTDTNGVYFRHLVINDVNTMPYNQNTTDVYTLWVEFPKSYENNAEAYEGIIDLVDIKINAEQVV